VGAVSLKMKKHSTLNIERSTPKATWAGAIGFESWALNVQGSELHAK
jgi:hypothetical protein